MFFFSVENEDKGKQNAETCESLLQLSFRDALVHADCKHPFKVISSLSHRLYRR
jgi:hypothetical protein